jgi:subtilisin family serine protease
MHAKLRWSIDVLKVSILVVGFWSVCSYEVNAESCDFLQKGFSGFSFTAKDFSIPESSSEKAWLAQGSSKISANLKLLAKEAQGKSFQAAADKAFELNVPYNEGRAAVSLTARDGRSKQALADRIEALGGTVTTTLDNTVYAELPLSEIEKLDQVQELEYAKAQMQFYPTEFGSFKQMVSDGLEATQATRLHQAGVTGKGVKIGIIDGGFHRYDELVNAGELPQPKAQHSFSQTGQMNPNNEVHGTGCAEIIHGMAPEAELYLAAVDGRADKTILAAEWLVQQGVDIISHSMGAVGYRTDGLTESDKLVDKIVSEHGILWITSAGNAAEDHWMGTTVDQNNDGFIDVSDSPLEDIIIIGHGGGPLKIAAVWDDWGSNPQMPAANQDIDIYLFTTDEKTQKPIFVSASENPQNGRGEPVEVIAGSNAPPGIYVLLLKPKHITQAVNIRVMLFQSRAKLCPTVATGSIGIPATARNALAVGAVDVQTGKLSSYSSQGPTDDGRLKPEVSAPDNNLSLAYGQSPGQPGRFTGTSAACPHVSGFAALLKQMNPNASVNELRQSVIQNVRVIGQAPNNQYGYGHIDASKVQVAGADTESATEQTLSTEESLELLKPLLDLAE